MQFQHEEQGLVDVFHLAGRLDYTAVATDFEDQLKAPWLGNPLRRFPVLELSGVTMMSSQALRAILALAKELKGQQGKVFVAAPSPAAREAFRVSGFLEVKVFEMHEQLPDAMLAAATAARQADPPPASTPHDPWKMPEARPDPVLPKSSLIGDVFKGIKEAWLAAARAIDRVLLGKKKD